MGYQPAFRLTSKREELKSPSVTVNLSDLPLVLSGFPSCTLKLYYELPTQSWFLFLHYELICLSWNFLPYLCISYNETCYFLYFHGHIILLMYIILIRITSNLSIQFACVFVSKVHLLEIEYSCPPPQMWQFFLSIGV